MTKVLSQSTHYSINWCCWSRNISYPEDQPGEVPTRVWDGYYIPLLTASSIETGRPRNSNGDEKETKPLPSTVLTNRGRSLKKGQSSICRRKWDTRKMTSTQSCEAWIPTTIQANYIVTPHFVFFPSPRSTSYFSFSLSPRINPLQPVSLLSLRVRFVSLRRTLLPIKYCSQR